ncbi:MAG: hypothetical protein KVP17_003510 [Porospora cf. gigantea B]|uniref:uncharacterized protein n=1 Tax=Porospora cf. gigantea B TaxID=2853592 RepID=UPI0035718F54|nr:MAG: hypothetical protein KVP17_003510 [Porospora cf. gigantea B]
MSVFAGVSQLKQFEENSAVRIANPLRLKQRLVPRTTDSEPPPSPTLELKRSLSRASDRQFECDDDAVVACSEELRQRLLSVGDKRQRLETVDEDPVYMLEGPVSVRFDGISVTAVTTTGPPWAKQVEEKLIVKNVSGVLMPFRLTAIMGASGAGKSTLLNVLSRKLRSRVDGDVYYNQVRVSRSQALSCSRFVQQEDIFYPFITSSEHLEAQSKLRLPRQTKADQHTRAREVLDNFNLSKVADTRIGHAVEGKAGLSGGERKRLSVATEMISSPPLLFADEPTTGLDSSMAEVVIKKLKDLTLRGHCVACTIHQPSSTLFQKFDDLILMADGNVLYAGDTMGVVKWFKDKFGLVCPSTANPADFIIRVTGISDHVDRQVKVDQLEGWAETWRREGEAFLESWFAGDRDVFFDEMRQIYFTTAQLMGAGKKSMRLLEDRWLDLEDDAFGRRGSKPIEFVASEEITIKPETVTGNVRVASWWRQLGIMTSRCYKDVQRNPGVMLTKLIQAIIAAVLISMFIFQLTFNLVDVCCRGPPYTVLH